jgi:hypothetical protein
MTAVPIRDTHGRFAARTAKPPAPVEIARPCEESDLPAHTHKCPETIRDLAATVLSALAVAFSLLTIGALVVFLHWFFVTGMGHDDRVRERVAQDGCPYDASADTKRVPGARDREFARRYCGSDAQPCRRNA